MSVFKSGTLKDAGALLEHDHHMIDRVLADVGAALDEGELERAGDGLREAAERLEHHMRAEEEILFPALARQGLTAPTLVMRREHERIAVELDALEEALEKEHTAAAREVFARLGTLLSDHNRKEEAVLYPRAAAVLSRDMTDAIAKLIS
jgi:hemerythrin-like domain-containing protein